MAATYRIIKAGIPEHFQFGSGMVWDPLDPYVYMTSAFTYPEDGSWFYKYNRQTLQLETMLDSPNRWASVTASIDRERRLYYIARGGTSVLMPRGIFKTSDLSLISTAQSKSGSVCSQHRGIQGIYLTGSTSGNQFWWHISVSTLFIGDIHCYYMDRYCDESDPERPRQLLNYTVLQTAFQSPGGFFSTGYKFQAADSDPEGNLWCYFAGLDGNGVIRHWLWKIDPGGGVTLDADLKDSWPIPSNGQAINMRWFKDDNSLIISDGRGYLKYFPGTGAASKSLLVPETSRWPAGTNYASFHHTDDRIKSIWVAYLYNDNSVPVPSGSWPRFPGFAEIRMSDLTLGHVLRCPEIVAEYPPVAPAPAINYGLLYLHEALQDPVTGELWGSFNNRAWIGVFKFDGVSPPGGGEGQEDPFCSPKNRTLNSSVSGSLGSSGSGNSLTLTSTNRKVI